MSYIFIYIQEYHIPRFRPQPGFLQYFAGDRNTSTSSEWYSRSLCGNECVLEEPAYKVCYRQKKGNGIPFTYFIVMI